MNKRYYKKLQNIQLQKQRQSNNGDDSSSYSRSRSSNIFQLQRLHDSNLELGDIALDQGGGATAYDNQYATSGYNQNKNNKRNSRSRDYDIFRQNSVSQGPLSTNDSPTKDFLEYSSTKNDIISYNMQTSINSTVRSSLVIPQNILKNLNQFDNGADGSNQNPQSIKHSQELTNFLQEEILVEQKQNYQRKDPYFLSFATMKAFNSVQISISTTSLHSNSLVIQNQFIESITKSKKKKIKVKYFFPFFLPLQQILNFAFEAIWNKRMQTKSNLCHLNKGCGECIVTQQSKVDFHSLLPIFYQLQNKIQQKKPFKKRGILEAKEKSLNEKQRKNSTKIFFSHHQYSFLQGIPEKPALVHGKVHRHLFSFVMSEKVLEINPDICSLIFYENEKDIPKKPGQYQIYNKTIQKNITEIIFIKSDIYPFKDISCIKEYKPTLFMKKNYHYIKISYAQEIIIGFRYKSTQSLWLFHLQKAFEYCKYVESKIECYMFQHNYKKLQRSILLTSMIEDPDNNLILEDKERITDNPSKKKSSKSGILAPIQQNKQSLEKSQQKNKETTTTVFSDRPTNQKGTDIFKLDNIEESKNEDLVSNKSKLSYIKPSYLEETEKIKLSSFDILDIIGSGAFGRVFLAQKKNNKQMFYALKSLKKHQLLNKNYLKYAQTELNILKRCRSPFIIGLHASFQTQNYIYMALDYCPGGDLGLILTQKNGMKEKTIKFIIAQVVLAIEYIHNMHVIYRDLKPENILLDQEGYIRLADFGLSRENVKEDEVCKSFCGSPAYISPEQLLKIGATKKTDIYGIGCIMYEMYSGNPPFYDQDIETLFENIKNEPIQFNENFSPTCKDLLEKMLHKEYEKRPTINQVKAHPYFKKMDWDQLYYRKIPVPEEILECIDLNGPMQNNYNYQNATIFKDAEYDQNQPNQKYKIENWSFVQHNQYEYL